MWFEILPSLGVMVGAMSAGCYLSSWVPQTFLNGHKAYRDNTDPAKLNHYHRDCRLAGHYEGPYYAKTLADLPDDEAPKAKGNPFMPQQ